MTTVESEFRPWNEDAFFKHTYSEPVTLDEFKKSATNKTDSWSNTAPKTNTDSADQQDILRVERCSPRHSDGVESNDEVIKSVGSFAPSQKSFELIYSKSDMDIVSTESQVSRKGRSRTRGRKIRDMFRSKTPVRMFRRKRASKKSNQDKKDVRDEDFNEAVNPLHGIVEVREMVLREEKVDETQASSKKEVEDVAKTEDENIDVSNSFFLWIFVHINYHWWYAA